MQKLPPPSHPARSMFELGDLVDVTLGNNGRKPLTLVEARAAARRFFAGGKLAARRVTFFVLAGDDKLTLMSFGRRLGSKREWTFGAYRAPR